jgi:hypothetical protein
MHVLGDVATDSVEVVTDSNCSPYAKEELRGSKTRNKRNPNICAVLYAKRCATPALQFGTRKMSAARYSKAIRYSQFGTVIRHAYRTSEIRYAVLGTTADSTRA